MSLTGKFARAATDYDDPASLGFQFRARRIRPFLEMVQDAHARHGCARIVDVGGTESYWRIVPPDYLDEHNVTITILNLPGSRMPRDNGRFRFIEGDGCSLDMLDDSSYDIAHSNSVIEHVGDWERMVAFAREISRVAPRYFVQTPNFWFPLEPHFVTPFFHWLPMSTRVWMVRHVDLGPNRKCPKKDDALRVVESAHLLSRRRLRTLFSDAEIITERFLGLPKSLIAVRR